MSARTSILVFTLLFAFAWGSYDFVDYEHKIEAASYPENLTNSKTLKEFARLVEKHNLNVSLIVSTGKNYENDNTKEVMAMTMTFPVNSDTVTKATLEKDAFIKLAEAANEEKLTVAGTHASNNKLSAISNNHQGFPLTRAHKTFAGIKNGKTGFVFDEENYAAQYTFIVPGSDGKNTTTKVFYGDVDIHVVDKSANVKDTELTTIKKALVDAIFTYEDEIVPKAITAILDHQLPDRSWDAAGPVGDHNYLDSEYWVQLKFLEYNYVIFTS